MARYISTEKVQNHLELEEFNETDDPKLSVIERWISSSEDEVDNNTRNRWDLHTVEDELITPDCQSQEFLFSQRPLTRVITLEYQNGDEWTTDWTTIDSSDYRIVNYRISKIKTKDFFWKEEGLRVTYEAGYNIIPTWLEELSLLLVEKRYIMSRLGISAADSEVVSVAVIRITDKSNASLKYRLEGLQKEIDDRFKLLGRSMKSRNHSIGFMTQAAPPSKRYRYF